MPRAALAELARANASARSRRQGVRERTEATRAQPLSYALATSVGVPTTRQGAVTGTPTSSPARPAEDHRPTTPPCADAPGSIIQNSARWREVCESSARNVGPNVYTSLMDTANDSTCACVRGVHGGRVRVGQHWVGERTRPVRLAEHCKPGQRAHTHAARTCSCPLTVSIAGLPKKSFL